MLTLIQVLGEPATGKTTLMRAFIESLGHSTGEVRNNIGPDGRHFNYARGRLYPAARTIVMGIYDGAQTDGTDRLGLNTQPPMLKLLADLVQTPAYDGWSLVCEGDRFANLSFAREARAICPIVQVMLVASPETLAHRHILRADRQTEKWLQGRRTKMATILRECNVVCLVNQTFPHMLRNVHILQHLTNNCSCSVPPDGLPALPVAAHGARE